MDRDETATSGNSKNQTGRIKVLLVDDVELFLELEKTFFRRENFDLMVARNGEEAFDLVQQERPDLVFMDLYMPGANGDEVCRRIKRDPELQKIPVIMVTQAGREEDQERCRTAGCDEILLKPVNRGDFLAVASKQLNLANRAAPRYQARLLIHYGLRPQRLLSNYSVDLGEGGLFIATEALLCINTPLNVQFELPDGTEIQCEARVAWLNHPDWMKKPQLPCGMGVEFADLESEEVSIIKKFLGTASEEDRIQ